MNGIRKLHKIFIDERRKLLDIFNPNAFISDEYFRACAKYIPMLERLRKSNLHLLYSKAQGQVQMTEFKMYTLEEIS
jgi:hypothetical protein